MFAAAPAVSAQLGDFPRGSPDQGRALIQVLVAQV
jgi:hypothetical protein